MRHIQWRYKLTILMSRHFWRFRQQGDIFSPAIPHLRVRENSLTRITKVQAASVEQNSYSRLDSQLHLPAIVLIPILADRWYLENGFIRIGLQSVQAYLEHLNTEISRCVFNRLAKRNVNTRLSRGDLVRERQDVGNTLHSMYRCHECDNPNICE